MARRHDGMVDVELVADAPGDGSDPSLAPAARPQGRRPRSLLAVAAATALAVVAVLVGSAQEERAQREDRLSVSGLSGVPGIAPSLREPPIERWRVTTPVTSVLDGLVLTREDVAGGRHTVAHEALTGAVRWVAPDRVDPARPGLACRTTIHGGDLLVCGIPASPGEGAVNTDAVLRGTPERVVVLRTDDGRVRDERDLSAGAVGWTVVDDDLVLAERDGDTLRITRADLLGRTPVWACEVLLESSVRSRDLVVDARDGFVVLSGPRAAVIDGRTGTVLGTWAARGGRVPVQISTSSIGFAVWPSSAEGVWFDRHGAAGARIPGGPMEALVDDGSQPQVVLTRDSEVLRAVDVVRGPLWERPVVRYAPLRIGTFLVLADHDRLVTVDLLTGEELWSATYGLGMDQGSRLVTDGVRILVPSYDDRSGRQVTARSIADGAALWTMPLPAGLTHFGVEDGILMASGDERATFSGGDADETSSAGPWSACPAWVTCARGRDVRRHRPAPTGDAPCMGRRRGQHLRR
jgi:hypothetical protein